MDVPGVRRRMILAPMPRERERWYVLWLLTQGWAAQATAEALERDPHTIGRWLAAFGEVGPAALIFEHSGGSPALEEGQQAELKAAVQEPPTTSGIGLANWNWKAVWQFVQERFGISLNCLHRLGFAFKRPKKRLLQADAEKRDAFVAEYASLKSQGNLREISGKSQAQEFGAKIFFADEAHFRADAELRCKWVLKGEPALVDSTSPRYGEKASYYSVVCLETGEVEWMELEGNSNSETSAGFLEQLRERHSGRLNVIWDNAPAHRGEAVREWLGKPGVNLRLVNPRLHGGRLCRGTARTSTPTRPSGAG